MTTEPDIRQIQEQLNEITGEVRRRLSRYQTALETISELTCAFGCSIAPETLCATLFRIAPETLCATLFRIAQAALHPDDPPGDHP